MIDKLIFHPNLLQKQKIHSMEYVWKRPLATRRRQTILIIDDDENLNDLLKRYIVRAGFSVLVASNGSDALGLVQAELPEIQLAIIDFNMPGMNGIQTFEALQGLLPRLKAILYTGNPKIDELKRKCPEGMICLAKDFDFGVLLFLIRQLIAQI